MIDNQATTKRRDKIRIALIASPGLVPGGAERQMLLLAEGLPRDEFLVDFVCLKLAGQDAERAVAAGARVRVVGLKGRRASGLPLPLYLAYLGWTIARYIAVMAGRYDVVDAWLYHAYVLAALTRPFTRPRALLAGRRSVSASKARFNWAERVGDAVARRAVTQFVANSQAVMADVVHREGIAAARIRVIHDAVQLPEEMPLAERRSRRTSWSASDETIVVGSVASHKPVKMLELLIRVAARLAKAVGHRDFRLVVVGEGSHRPHLEALRAEHGVEDIVILHGVEPDARMIYGAFDIAVLASGAEGLPNVVLEAAAAGLPIVATDAGGTAEILTDGETGLLVPIGDEDGLVAALALLFVDPAERRRLGETARREVTTRFGVERMVAEFAELYRELAAGGPSQPR